MTVVVGANTLRAGPRGVVRPLDKMREHRFRHRVKAEPIGQSGDARGTLPTLHDSDATVTVRFR